MSEELVFCPFCGSVDITIAANIPGDYMVNDVVWRYGQFENCLAEGPWDLSRSRAAEKWNTRVDKETNDE